MHTTTKRPGPIPQAVGALTPQLVVLGGIWVPPEYATAAHSGGIILYGAHHAPPHFSTTSPMPQEFYSGVTAIAPPSPPLRHQLHNMYNAASREPDVREAGDRSEIIQDSKSESSSWKGERGGLAALREECEESSRSDISLKF
ncbi:EARLY FLOWERING MYB PROTEIN, HRS1 HOMOLOG4 [Hibiscus trionum]|uniref:EARLY FLOWERING MYB PROTEIN, HRS1 HOMOLOG4 n=1 Tax=Hibiscus trionum TaxID=183268 RepID=A0A9W7IGE5_HIBTR|nr:EARLY FLOWERING MYB PROTEIN, HRS1 HOMOLOG4 [Hibiscus trionum]